MFKRLLGMCGFIIAIKSLFMQSEYELTDGAVVVSCLVFAAGMTFYEWSMGLGD